MKKVLLFFLLTTLMSLSSCTKSKTTRENELTTHDLTKLFTEVSPLENSSFKVFETQYFEVKEEEMGVVKTLLNPYKSQDIRIVATFTSPSQKTYSKDAYYQVDYDLSLLLGGVNKDPSPVYPDEIEGQDFARKTGVEHFLISFRPKEEGTYLYDLQVFIKENLTQSFSGSFLIEENKELENYHGKIEVDTSNNRYFKYENGGTYLPIGLNIGWYTSLYRGSYDYDVYFEKMAEVGMNYVRIWLKDSSFALHMGANAKVDDFTVRQNQLSRLDRILGLAEKSGIYVTLVLLNHGQFSANTDPEWEQNPYSDFLSYPFQFFNSSVAKGYYQDELRYIVSRFGEYDSIFTYEMFNEVDWSDNFNYLYVKNWHKEMTSYLSSIDPYKRLITTSYKDPSNSSNTFALDTISYTTSHTYAYSSASGIVERAKSELQSLTALYNQPAIFEEWGVNASNGLDTYKIDPKGIMLYQAMMGSVFGGGAGSAMPWWWDTYIHEYKMYPLFQGLGEFAKISDLSGPITYLSKEDISLDDSKLDVMGIKTLDNTYLYIFDSTYTKESSQLSSFQNVNVILKESGTYSLIQMNPLNGVTMREVEVQGNTFKINFSNDTIIILKNKKE